MEGVMQLLIEYRYWILFPLACVEGPIVAFVAGVLVAAGYLHPLAAYIILILGDVVPDTIYYLIGRFGNRSGLIQRFAGKIGVTTEHFDKITKLWFSHTTRTMLVTKFAYGLSIPLLITSGIVKLPFNRFWTNTVPLSMIQYGILLALGYFLGHSYAIVESTVIKGQMLVAGAALIAGAYYFFGSKIKNRFLAQQKKG